MIQTAQSIEKLTLNITHEIHIHAPSDVTLETLLEISGPLFMSYPVVSNLQYRLSEADGGTLIKFQHTALGLIQENHRKGVSTGWSHIHERVRKQAEAFRSRQAASH